MKNTGSTTKMTQAITMQRVGQAAQMEPFVDDLNCFWTLRYQAAPDSRYGISLTSHHQQLWHHSRQGATLVPAGLAPLMAEFLRRRGYRVSEGNFPVRQLPKPRPPVVPDNPYLDPQFLRFIRRSERGVIRYFPMSDDATGVDPLLLIRQVILAWPKQRLLILCTRDQEVRRVTKRLAPAVPVLSGRGSGAPERVVVSTYHQAFQSAVDLKSIDLCIVLNPTECFSLRPTYSTHELFRGRPEHPGRNSWFWHLPSTTRLFGLLPVETTTTVQQRDLLLSLFGHNTLILPEHGRIHRHVVVAYARHHHRPLHRQNTALAIKRKLIWNNPIRNRRLAQLVRDLIRGDIDRIEYHCRGLLFDEATQSDARVCIAVDCLDHAYHLWSNLPHPPLCAADTPNFAGWNPHQIDWFRSLRRSPNPEDRLILATRSGLPRVGRCDVIVDATASSAPLTLPDEILLTDQHHDPLLLIDLLDYGNELLDEWRRRRELAHNARQIDHRGVTGALAQFLGTGVVR